MSTSVTAPSRAAWRAERVTGTARSERPRVSPDLVLGSALALGLFLIGFLAAGGTELAANTWVQVVLGALGALAAATVLLIGSGGRRWGLVTLVCFAALAALTYASIAWSLQPATSWLEANRTLSYLAVFAIALATARLFPTRWGALLGAVALATTALSACALVYKMFPGTLDPYAQLGRLIQPLDYWNAVGLMAAMGVPPCLWAGTRQHGPPWAKALAAPAIAILLSTLLLSYSRGALIVAVLGVICWFALVPLRLRGSLMLGIGAAGGAVISAWALHSHNLSADYVPLSQRVSSGHWFGLVAVLTLLACTAGGWMAAGKMETVVLSAGVRRRVNLGLIALVALLAAAGLGAVAASSRGLTGEISHIYTSLTSTSGGTGDQPGRLVALSNSRPRYWRDGFRVGGHHLLAGSGALGFATADLRYAPSDLQQVAHAHSYLVETFADFGLIGIAVSAALLVAWAIAAARPVRGPPGLASQERLAMFTLLSVVVVFGLHSLIDWTWFIPGTAVIALACAGWLAGRGPLSAAGGRAGPRRRISAQPALGLAVVALAAGTVFAGWVVVQPLRASTASAAAITALLHSHGSAALTDARQAAADNPVSVEPLFLLSQIYADRADQAQARRELVAATTLQPANPQVWVRLGAYDLEQHHNTLAVTDFRRAHALYPGSQSILKQLQRAQTAAASPA